MNGLTPKIPALLTSTSSDQGKLFFARAAQLIEQTDALYQFGRKLAADVEPVLRIVIDGVTPFGPLMDALGALRRAFPELHIELRTEILASVLDLLMRDEVDVAIAQSRDDLPQALECAHYAEVLVLPVVHRDHALARRAGPLTREDLLPYVHVVVRDTAPTKASYSLNVFEGVTQWTVFDVVVSLSVIVRKVFTNDLPQVTLPEWDDTRETLAPNRSDPAFRVGSKVWAARRLVSDMTAVFATSPLKLRAAAGTTCGPKAPDCDLPHTASPCRSASDDSGVCTLPCRRSSRSSGSPVP